MSAAVPIHDSPVAPWADRSIASVIVLAAVGCCAVLLSVPADPRGYGTHELLGMAPCSWPDEYGMPCPTCGVTTAAAHFVHLSPWRAFATHPFGAVLAGTGLWLCGLAFESLVRRRSFLARILALPYGTLSCGLLVLLLASWLYRYLTWAS